jgi:hypothetical protein
MRKPNFSFLYSPDDGGSPAPKPDLNESGIMNILNTLDDDKSQDDKKDDLEIPDIKEEDEDSKKKVAKSKKDEEDENEENKDEEDDELEGLDDLEEDDENKNEDEDELKLLIPARRKDILKAYPDLFKKFPALERAMYREQGYTEIYPTIKEAKASLETIKEYKELETNVLGGDIKSLLKSVKERDPEALNKIADNYLTDLYETDQTAYGHVLNNVFKYTIKAMVNTGKKNNDDQLLAAAELFHKFYFGDADYSEPTKLAKITDNKKSEVDAEREQFLAERFNDARDELGVRIDNKLKSVISQAIDPKGEMSDYVKSKAIEDCIMQLHGQIGNDARTQRIIRNLWVKSRETKFSKESVNVIGSAYLSVAKSLLLPIVRENRTKALSGAKRLVKGNDEKPEREKFKGSNDVKGERTAPKGKMNKGESVESFLMRD